MQDADRWLAIEMRLSHALRQQLLSENPLRWLAGQ
jgi:hypothetical protein